MAFLKTGLAIAAVAAGCQGGNLGGSPDAGGAVVDETVTGRWAMFAFEDPVAVDLRAAGGVIEGRGCCAGLGGRDGFGCCGAVTGQVADRHALFGFSFDFGGDPYEYATDAFVSTDGRRMAGTFTRNGRLVTWARIGSSDAWLPEPDPAIQEILWARQGSYQLLLSDDPAAGNDFVGRRMYQLDTSDRFVWGDLGAFWTGEMSWNAAEQTLVVGPVAETMPGLPVTLLLRFEGALLVSVEAATASGARYHFQPALNP